MKAQGKSYSWSVKGGKVHCCTSETSDCTVTEFWEVGELTAFHDAELQQVTKEINAILDGVKKGNKEPKRHASFIQVQDRHFLVWASHDIVGPSDDDKTIRKMLRLKT